MVVRGLCRERKALGELEILVNRCQNALDAGQLNKECTENLPNTFLLLYWYTWGEKQTDYNFVSVYVCVFTSNDSLHFIH